MKQENLFFEKNLIKNILDREFDRKSNCGYANKKWSIS